MCQQSLESAFYQQTYPGIAMGSCKVSMSSSKSGRVAFWLTDLIFANQL